MAGLVGLGLALNCRWRAWQRPRWRRQSPLGETLSAVKWGGETPLQADPISGEVLVRYWRRPPSPLQVRKVINQRKNEKKWRHPSMGRSLFAIVIACSVVRLLPEVDALAASPVALRGK